MSRECELSGRPSSLHLSLLGTRQRLVAFLILSFLAHAAGVKSVKLRGILHMEKAPPPWALRDRTPVFTNGSDHFMDGLRLLDRAPEPRSGIPWELLSNRNGSDISRKEEKQLFFERQEGLHLEKPATPEEEEEGGSNYPPRPRAPPDSPAANAASAALHTTWEFLKSVAKGGLIPSASAPLSWDFLNISRDVLNTSAKINASSSSSSSSSTSSSSSKSAPVLLEATDLRNHGSNGAHRQEGPDALVREVAHLQALPGPTGAPQSLGKALQSGEAQKESATDAQQHRSFFQALRERGEPGRSSSVRPFFQAWRGWDGGEAASSPPGADAAGAEEEEDIRTNSSSGAYVVSVTVSWEQPEPKDHHHPGGTSFIETGIGSVGDRWPKSSVLRSRDGLLVSGALLLSSVVFVVGLGLAYTVLGRIPA